jgi:hypothetical protein
MFSFDSKCATIAENVTLAQGFLTHLLKVMRVGRAGV